MAGEKSRIKVESAFPLFYTLLATTFIGGCSRNQPPPSPRTAAEILALMEKDVSDGHSEAALDRGRDYLSVHFGTPEADSVVKQVGKLAAAIDSAKEAERIRAVEAAATAETQRLANKWFYQIDIDPMTSRKSKYATIQSENTVVFDFPYQGPQYGKLTIRNHPTYGRDVIFSIERGQLLCPSYENCELRVRFDNREPEQWYAGGPADNSATSIFLRNEERFIRKLRAAKVVRLQVVVYQEGNPMFEFQVGGFDYARYQGGT